ncbi:rhodanese-like domain-containing protein [Thiobacillus sp.]|uniref:rhodanese-like domain-containing protein n=1 Tax=Thiobacillus sp. TaxID=924 RepID=UPI001810738F|nr:rhodanese-like domain-containing protein [Thiobacillus sp.]MBC2732492.1 rhodanese-like domain-containing protein [Thiobacillus sp.]MBC2741231.1 rhodanese-like domain-containing protein [Thiobacillus sp.]MBC2761407.1 rhodanese-like domain-containing protein [Thiobacillus sp.]
MNTVRIIDRGELLACMDSGMAMRLIEALPERYYNEAHLPGAVRLNHDEVRAQAADLLPDRDALVVVYCANARCRNSHMAANTLAAMGYTQVAVYADGKQDWLDAGLRVESESTDASV